MANLSSAPLPSTTDKAVATANYPTHPTQQAAAQSVDWFSKPVRSTGTHRRTSGTSGSGSETAVKPIVYPNPTKTSGSGSSGTHPVAGSGTPPTDTSGITSVTAAVQQAVAPVTAAVQDVVAPVTSVVAQVLPVVQGLVSQVPIVSTLVQGTGSAGTVSTLPAVGSLL
jgi:hypothetical protein